MNPQPGDDIPRHHIDALRRAGIRPVPFSCAGMHRLSGQAFGICHTCARYGALGIEPAAVLVGGVASCANHVQMVPAGEGAAQTAKQGAPVRVESTDTAQTEGA